MATRRWPVILGAVIALALGGGVFLMHQSQSTATVTPGKAGPTAARARVAVETAAVTLDTIVEDIRAFGTLVANESVVISPEIAGRVAKINFKESDPVEAGAVLVELDADILSAELAKARSDVNLATANYERASTLASQGTGTLRARDEASAAFHVARANLTLAEARLAKTKIVAPFSGVVGFRAISVGAYLSPGDTIVELASIGPLKVDFRVSETYLSNLRVGLPVHMTVDARPGESIVGEIVAVDPIVDIDGRAVRLRAQVRTPDRHLLPGLFARIRIILEQHPDAILMPESALFQDGGKLFAYRLVDGRAVQTPVSIGQRRPGFVEVQDGLATDSVVVTAGHQQLRDGLPVEVVSGPGKP